ncbi:MAG: DNA-binding protein [Nitrospirota bacterium]
MKKHLVSGIVLIVALLVMVSLSFAQQTRNSWEPGSQYSRMYNPATVETISGTVDVIQTFTLEQSKRPGIHMMVKTDKETVEVHLGPKWYLDNQDIIIQKGDKVDVTGSRVTYQEKPAIIAKEVKKGDSVLMLRNDSGIPLWAGWRKWKKQ